MHTQYQELQEVEQKDEDGNLIYDEYGNVKTKEEYVLVNKYYSVIANRTLTVYDLPEEIFFYVSTGSYNIDKCIAKAIV